MIVDNTGRRTRRHWLRHRDPSPLRRWCWILHNRNALWRRLRNRIAVGDMPLGGLRSRCGSRCSRCLWSNWSGRLDRGSGHQRRRSLWGRCRRELLPANVEFDFRKWGFLD